MFLVNLLTISALLLEIFWVLTDPRTTKERYASYLSKARILYSLYITFYFSLNYLSAVYFPLPYSGFDELFVVFGIVIFIIGIILSVWSKTTMGKVWGAPSKLRKDQDKLITSGPFNYSRNPIYIGLILILIGYGLALQSYFTFLAIVPIIYFWKSVEKEEKLLELKFKKEYLEYKKRVPRFF